MKKINIKTKNWPFFGLIINKQFAQSQCQRERDKPRLRTSNVFVAACVNEGSRRHN
jgi:hypothetical protein